MTNKEKLDNLLNAIESVTTLSDGSTKIEWKQNVVHNVNGFFITCATGSAVVSGEQVHLNPETLIPLNELDFIYIEKELEAAVIRAEQEDKKPRDEVDTSCC